MVCINKRWELQCNLGFAPGPGRRIRTQQVSQVIQIPRFAQDIDLIDMTLPGHVIIGHFLDTVNGGLTIQTFGWNTGFSKKNQENPDESQKPFYMLLCLRQWLTLMMDLLVMVMAVALVATTILLNEGEDA